MIRSVRNTHGFTLPELMIAVTLAGIITTVLASTWWITLRFNERLTGGKRIHSDTADRVRIQRFLSSAVLNGHPALQDGFLLTRSDSGEIMLITWVSPGSFSVPDAETDPCRLQLITNASDGLRMIIEPGYFAIPDGSADPVYEHFLFTGRGTCSIEALGCDGHWHPTWNSAETHSLPQAVRIQFNPETPGFPGITISLPAAGRC